MSSRKVRSRSPLKVDSVGRRRERDSKKDSRDTNNIMDNTMQTMMNPQMMMYQQGNMMMAGNMYPNMMMPNAMGMGMGTGMMTTTGMEMMQQSSMDLMQQPTMDMSNSMTPQAMAVNTTGMDMSSMMGGVMMDPSMMSMYSNMTDMTGQDKKEIVLKHCILTPPTPETPTPPKRVKPPGCRTIFVGGLPDKIRESIVRDIFENYGRIQTLRLSKKNFCHIRFDAEDCVDAAMMISGYQIKLTDVKKDTKEDDMDEDDDSHATVGWLHVDYALSRDDQNEYERRQRQALRMQQAQMELSVAHPTSNRHRSPSPVRIQTFSNTAMSSLSDKIKSEDYFAASLPTLVSWLERGECSKKNVNQFYSMLQATNAHIRRLYNEKMQSEEELTDCKERVKNRIAQVIEQLEQVAKVFSAATHQRVWDHFTKPQRKNIETWQKMTQEFSSLKDEFNEKFLCEDTEYNNGYNNKPLEIGQVDCYELQKLKVENESLQFQLMAYKNEVDVIKADASKEMEKFKAQFIARQALQGALPGIGETNTQTVPPPLPSPVEKPPPPPLPEDLDAQVHLKEAVERGCGEAKLIGVMSAFLQVHPQGASLDYVVSYVRALFPHASQATVHHVLQKHTDVFLKKTTGVGANMDHRWTFIAFQPDDDMPDSKPVQESQ